MSKRRNRQSRRQTLNRRRKAQRTNRTSGLGFEPLESRRLLAAVTVGNTLDVVNAPDTTSISALMANDGGDGISLREAIAAANSQAGSDTISFDPSVFNGEASDVIRLQSGQLAINEAVHIDGGSHQVVISGDANGDDTLIGGTFITDIAASATAGTLSDNNGRVVDIVTPAGDEVKLTGLTITGGDQGGNFSGGGVVGNSANLVIVQSSISGNRATDDGGGIHISYGAVTLTDSTISGNFATNDGGGIYSGYGDLTLTNSTISGNSSGSRGGGFFSYTDGPAVTNSTISGNIATTGGGLYLYLGDGNINNSIVAGNFGGNIGSSGDPTFFGDFNLLGPGDTTGGANDIIISSNDPLLGPLADNGGPTLTHALLSASPAINAGDPATVAGQGMTPLFDQRGAGFDRVQEGRVDIGSFESVREAQSLVVTTSVDVTNVYDNLTSLREAIGFANSQAGVDTITFDASISGQTITLDGAELAITESLTIDASALTENVTVDANQLSRVLNFTAATGDLDLHGLNISQGNANEGGGILFASGGLLLISESNISQNLASNGNGGAILTSAGDVTLFGSTLNNNTALGDGGAVYTLNGDITLVNSTVSGNVATDDGGGISTTSGAVNLSHSTVTLNTAGDVGGGLHRLSSAGLTINNSIVAGNIANGSAPDLQAPGPVPAVSYSLIGDNAGTTLVEAPTADAAGNLIGSASGGGIISPQLQVLADNRGPTQTHALTPASPALNTGDPAAVAGQATIPLFDQRGTGFVRIGEGRLDMGSYELLNREAPVFTSPATANVVENTQAVHTLSATDADLPAQTVTLSIAGAGADNEKFEVVGNVLRFIAAPDFENPTDSGGTDGDNVYEVSVRADDGNQGLTTQTINVTVTNVAESMTYVVDLAADENDGDFSAGDLSLREAIGLANANLGADAITFDAAVFNGEAADVIRLQTGQLAVNEAVHIDGGSQRVVISGDADGDDTLIAGTFITDIGASDTAGTLGDNNGRVLDIVTPAGDEVKLTGLTITGGDQGGNFSGGGVVGNNANLVIVQSSISGNRATDDGGGIFMRDGTVTLTDSTVSGNVVTRAGGGIYSRYGDVTLSNSTVSGNTGSFGGGIYSNDGTVTLTSSTVSGNNTGTSGGGIYAYYGTISLTNSTVSGNRSGSQGGGILAYYSSVAMTNSIVAGNTGGNLESFNQNQSGNFNLLGPGDTIGGANDIIISSNEPLLGPLADNGGPTRTHALLAGSPAIDSGDPTTVAGQGATPLFDQRGSGFDRVQAGQIDIGAFELQSRPVFTSLATANVAENTQVVQTLTAVSDQTSEIELRLLGQAPSGDLGPGQTLTAEQAILSPDATHQLVFQTDGNLVSYGPGDVVKWASNTNGLGATTARINADGNLVILNGLTIVYQTMSANAPNSLARLHLTNEGQPVILRVDGERLWEGTLGNAFGAGTVASPTSLSSDFATGADNDQFEIVAGELRFMTAPDFEIPTDANGDNVYEVSVVADGGAGGVTPQTIAVTVTDVNEPALPGDYNLNGTVDAADYTVWRDALGSSVPIFTGADGDGDGAVTNADYQVWRSNFGATLPLPALAAATANSAVVTAKPIAAVAEKSVETDTTSQRGFALLFVETQPTTEPHVAISSGSTANKVDDSDLLLLTLSTPRIGDGADDAVDNAAIDEAFSIEEEEHSPGDPLVFSLGGL